MPHPFRSFGACVLAAALALSLAACGSGGKHTAQKSDATTPEVLAVKTSVLKVGSVDVESAGPSTPINTATGKAVLSVAQKYIDNAVFAPLKTGKLGTGYATLFDPGVRAAAVGPDQNALTDVGVGKVTSLSTKATPVHLSSLDGTLGDLMYLATDFDIDVKATAAAGPLTIHRHIELTFAPSGTKWLVTAYRVVALRKSATHTTTTTATGGTTP